MTGRDGVIPGRDQIFMVSFSVATEYVTPSLITRTVPSRSVRRTSGPAAFSRSKVSRCGWPYSLSLLKGDDSDFRIYTAQECR